MPKVLASQRKTDYLAPIENKNHYQEVLMLPIRLLQKLIVPGVALAPLAGFGAPFTPEVQDALRATPTYYGFSSQFDGQDSVSYTGQSFRQVLISDLKSFMGSGYKADYAGDQQEALSALQSYFRYQQENDVSIPGVVDGITEFQYTVKGMNGIRMMVDEGEVYDDIQAPGKNLIKKIAGNDNPLRRGQLYGWDVNSLLVNGRSINLGTKGGVVTPENLVDFFFEVYAEDVVDGASFQVRNETIRNAGVLSNGWDVAQLTQKFLHGAVSFSQASGDYLMKGLSADNSAAVAGKNYTKLAHYWDEGFGYFGAARDYLDYSDTEIVSGGSRDADGNGRISLLKEVNFPFAKNGAKRDLGVAGLDLTKDTMTPFLQGRSLISQKPAGYKQAIDQLAADAVGAWERIIAATVIHYINKTVMITGEYQGPGYLFKNHAKYWSEMKGYGLAFQFNPRSKLTDAQFDQVHGLMKSAPVLPSKHSQGEVNQYIRDLMEARQILADAFSFTSEQAQNL